MRFTIKQNTPLTSCVYRMTLQGDTSAITAPTVGAAMTPPEM